MLGAPELDAAMQVGSHQMEQRGGISSLSLLAECACIHTRACVYDSVLTILDAFTSNTEVPDLTDHTIWLSATL